MIPRILTIIPRFGRNEVIIIYPATHRGWKMSFQFKLMNYQPTGVEQPLLIGKLRIFRVYMNLPEGIIQYPYPLVN